MRQYRAKQLLLRKRGAAVAPTPFGAYSLALAVGNTTFPPEFLAHDDGETWNTGDELELIWSNSPTVDGTGAFAAIAGTASNIIDSSEAAAEQATFAGLSGMTTGTRFFMFRAKRTGYTPGAWSNIVAHGDGVAPTITSSATPSVAENTPLAHNLTANETVTWSIVGGADAASFEINASVVLRFLANGVADYETKNSYAVTVRATDLAGNATDQAITLSITDQDENPDAFGPTDLTGQALSTLVESGEVTIAGLGSGVTVPISISGTGQYAIDTGSGYGAWTSSAGTIANGHKVKRRLTTSASYLTAVSNTLTIGGGTDNWSATTMADPSSASLALQGSVLQALPPFPTSYTFNAVSLPAGDLVLIVQTDKAVAPGGVVLSTSGAATKLVDSQSADGQVGVSFWRVTVAGAGNQNITITPGGGATLSTVGLAVFLGTSLGTVYDTSNADSGQGYPGNPVSAGDSLDGGSGRIGIAAFFSLFGTNATWANGTEVFDVTDGTINFGAAVFTTTDTPQVSRFGQDLFGMCGVSFNHT